MLAIKVCNPDRVNRKAVIVNKASETLISDVIAEASATLGMAGDSLVLEEDGVLIDNNLLIIGWKEKLLMLLKKNQHWSATNQANCSSNENETPNVNTKSSQKKSTESGNN